MSERTSVRDILESSLATLEVVFDKTSSTISEAAKTASTNFDMEVKIKRLEYHKRNALNELGETVYKNFLSHEGELVDFSKIHHIEYLDKEIADLKKQRAEAQEKA